MNEIPATAYGVIRLFSVEKSGIERFSKQLITAVENGEVNALELKIALKAIEKVIEKVDEGTKENQLKASESWSEKKFNAFGADVEKAEVGTKYNYSVCNDPVYNHRLGIMESAKQQLDERANFLKNMKESTTIVDEGSGEVVRINPPLKTSQSGLKISFK